MVGAPSNSQTAERNVYRHPRYSLLLLKLSLTSLVRYQGLSLSFQTQLLPLSARVPFPLAVPKYFKFPNQFIYLGPWIVLVLTSCGSNTYLSGELLLSLQNLP